ncbi:MAG: hypothetical protein ABL894_10625 [Hyphomicrobium sp.]
MTLKSCLFAFGATFALAVPAMAEAPATPAAGAATVKIGKACKTDMQTLCAGIDAKGGGRARCLRTNQAKLSPDCAKAVAAKPASWGQQAAAAPGAAPAEKK